MLDPQIAKTEIGKCPKLVFPMLPVVTRKITVLVSIHLSVSETIIAEFDVADERTPNVGIFVLGRTTKLAFLGSKAPDVYRHNGQVHWAIGRYCRESSEVGQAPACLPFVI